MTLTLGMHHRVLECYQICSNDDPGLTMTNFTASQLWSFMLLSGKKGKTMDFSETIVVYDLKLATDDRSDRAVCPLPRGYIHVLKHVLNHEQNCIKSDFKEISLKLAANG